MKGKILLIHIRRKDERSLYRILRSTRSHLDFSHDLEESRDRLRRGRYDLLLVDWDNLASEPGDGAAIEFLREAARAQPHIRILVLSREQRKQALVELLEAGFLTNLIAKNTDIEAEEIVVTVEKILRQDLFGLEKYLTWGIEPEQETITHSREKDEKLARLERFGEYLGLNSRLVELAKGVADEFIMNAVYNAPVRDGAFRYSKLPRTERVDLEAHEHVTFRYACDGRHLGLSVTDEFGSLTLSTIQRYLAKCFTRDENQIGSESGGAGMGFYYIFTSLSQFIINIEPGRRTEMIGLLDVSGSYRHFVERPKSFNVFVTE